MWISIPIKRPRCGRLLLQTRWATMTTSSKKCRAVKMSAHFHFLTWMHEHGNNAEICYYLYVNLPPIWGIEKPTEEHALLGSPNYSLTINFASLDVFRWTRRKPPLCCSERILFGGEIQPFHKSTDSLCLN